MGAWGSGRGGGWEIKNAGCRKHGDLVKGDCSVGGLCVGGPQTRSL